MKDYNCEWDKDCPNKATQELMREEKSNVVGDCFASGISIPAMPYFQYIKVCNVHFPEAYASFFKETDTISLVKPLNDDQNVAPPGASFGLNKKCPTCQADYGHTHMNFCLNCGSPLQSI